MRIVVAMSGGVDSSVAAALLAEQGHDVIGLSMQLYDSEPTASASFGSCCTLDDLHDARRVAAAIDIPHYILNFERQFDEQVVSNFVSEYAAGRTPLPCAHCNSDLKFATLARARARLRRRRRRHRPLRARRARRRDGRTAIVLKRGVDPAKDQSYFLFSLTQEQLARAVFPVGDRPKDAVRDYARRRGCRSPTSRTARRSASFPTTTTRRSSTQHAPDAARRRRDRRRSRGACSAATPASIASRSASARASACRSSPTGAPLYVLALRPAERQVDRRPEGVARADDADRVGRELDCRRAGRPRGASPRRSAIGITPAPATVARARRRPRRGRLRRAADRRHARPGRRVLRRRYGRRRRVDRLS